MAITFILDISHHQDLSLDLARARRDGCEGCFLKAGEGSTYVDPTFTANLAEGRAAGQLMAAYWYQRANASAAAHVAKIQQVVPKDVPVILDVEANSGTIALTREIIRLLNAAGYSTPLVYVPRWYWQQVGSPSLSGLPPLWSSRYPNNRVGLLPSEWAEVPASYWDGYGGNSVAVLQFTSSASIAGKAPLDASAFRGTREQLAALLNQSVSQESESDMWSEADFNTPIFTDDYEGPNQRTIRFRDVMLELRERSAQSIELTELLMKQSPASADEIAKALQPGLVSSVLPLLTSAIKEALGADNQEQADEVAKKVLELMGKKLSAPAGEGAPAEGGAAQ